MNFKLKKLSKILIFLALYNLGFAIPKYDNEDEKRLNAVKEFYTNVLKDGKSKSNPTPLLADGINILTKEPVEWIFPNGEKVKISNFANKIFLELLFLLVKLLEIQNILILLLILPNILWITLLVKINYFIGEDIDF